MNRRQRIHDILNQRLGWVRCAIEPLHQRHNASAVLRTTDAVGIHHVHVVGERFAPGHSAARGTHLWLGLHHHPTVEAGVQAVADAGFDLWVADLADGAVTPEEVPLDRPICLWFGAELMGVDPIARAAATGAVTVPMRGFAQSLNVSVAAALVLRPVAERARAELGDRALLPADERDRIRAEWMAREEAMRRGIDARTS